VYDIVERPRDTVFPRECKVTVLADKHADDAMTAIKEYNAFPTIVSSAAKAPSVKKPRAAHSFFGSSISVALPEGVTRRTADASKEASEPFARAAVATITPSGATRSDLSSESGSADGACCWNIDNVVESISWH
jgi:hypothetical protein